MYNTVFMFLKTLYRIKAILTDPTNNLKDDTLIYITLNIRVFRPIYYIKCVKSVRSHSGRMIIMMH